MWKVSRLPKWTSLNDFCKNSIKLVSKTFRVSLIFKITLLLTWRIRNVWEKMLVSALRLQVRWQIWIAARCSKSQKVYNYYGTEIPRVLTQLFRVRLTWSSASLPCRSLGIRTEKFTGRGWKPGADSCGGARAAYPPPQHYSNRTTKSPSATILPTELVALLAFRMLLLSRLHEDALRATPLMH